MSSDEATQYVDTGNGPPVTDSSPGGVVADLAVGTTIGRYVLLRELGRSGMGVVYAAYDPELDRQIAFKVIGRRGGKQAREEHARLLREAQALARVSHPNVIAVHDVGTFEGRVFVAMEFLDGRDLSDWIDKGRDWPEVLQVYVQAGRGLAAAHAAGLVHRDFKPENVFMPTDGRVRVLDFGLAREGGEGTEVAGIDIEAALAAPDPEVTLSSRVTQAGRIVGTPAFMAPEQFAGATVDARSDQFSFCVALYEALYGERPYAGTDPGVILFQIHLGKVRPAPAGSRVPSWLRAALLRGLAAKPDDRWPSMDALLAELERDRSRPWRIAGVTAIIVAALATGVVIARPVAAPDVAPACEEAGAGLEAHWNDDTRRAIEAAFSATALPYAGDAVTRVHAGLDAYARDWSAMRREACEATRVEGTQSEALLDLRMTCLDQRRDDFVALVEVLSSADAKAVEKSVSAVGSLPGLHRCADAEGLRAAVAPPDDPKVAAEVDAIRKEASRLRARLAAGQFKPIEQEVAELHARADATGYAPIAAELDFLMGRRLEMAGEFDPAAEQLREAVWSMLGYGDRPGAARVAGLLAVIDGYHRGHPDQGSIWSDMEMSLIGPDAHPDRRAEALDHRGTVEFAGGRLVEARADYEEALALEQGLDEPGEAALSNTHMLLANVVVEMGENELARSHYEKALEISERAFGPSHPRTAKCINNLGIALERLELWEEAARTHERGLALKKELLGEKHPSLGASLGNLANVYLHQGELPKAREAYEQARDLFIEALGEDHPFVALARRGLGEVGIAEKNWSAAEADLRASLKGSEGPPEEDVPGAHARFLLGRVLVESGTSSKDGHRLVSQARAAMISDDTGASKDKLALLDEWRKTHPAPMR